MSAHVWATASTKGGAGKTTLIAILAGEIMRLGGTVALIDGDPNTPLLNWVNRSDLAKRIPVIVDTDPEGSELESNIEKASGQAEFVLLDTEGTENARSALAAQLADLVLIPMQYSALDLNEATKVRTFLTKLETRTGRARPNVIVPTRVPAAIRSRTQKGIGDQLTAQGFPVLDPPVLEKDAYRQIFSEGCLLQDLPPAPALTSAHQNAQALLQGLAAIYGAAHAA
ncbi:ParA family protein [uncultured Ruegeria sp.]|uniref:ParA family protein n=1 Tax=uncultured Ruegeria sp. TaxID=259304 RepID=UPI00262975B3|nr:ParA family protein [uncultured Ruegeria sp.]